MKKIKIKEGQKFNKLTALKYIFKNKNYQQYWLFKCDCGKEKEMRICSIISGVTKSCGCFTDGLIRKTENSAFEKLYRDYSYGSQQRGLDFELDKEFFRNLTIQKCTYCGREPYNVRYNQAKSEGYLYSGIDRVDSSKGYLKDNVTSCCSICNRMKSNISSEDFINTIKLIFNNLNIE